MNGESSTACWMFRVPDSGAYNTGTCPQEVHSWGYWLAGFAEHQLRGARHMPQDGVLRKVCKSLIRSPTRATA